MKTDQPTLQTSMEAQPAEARPSFVFGDRVTVAEDLWVVPPMPGGPGMIRPGMVGVLVADAFEKASVRWKGALHDMLVTASALRKVEV